MTYRKLAEQIAKLTPEQQEEPIRCMTIELADQTQVKELVIEQTGRPILLLDPAGW